MTIDNGIDNCLRVFLCNTLATCAVFAANLTGANHPDVSGVLHRLLLEKINVLRGVEREPRLTEAGGEVDGGFLDTLRLHYRWAVT